MSGGSHEVADYVAELCTEMQHMAAGSGLILLAELLKATAAEARRHRKPSLRVVAGGLSERRGPE
jgi:hypothetical protein